MIRWILIVALSLASACSGEQDTAKDCLGRPVSGALTGTARLTWDPPTTRTDGSPIDDLSGYKVYYGVVQKDLRCQIEIRDPKATSREVRELSPGTWYFAVVSVDSARVESAPSDVVSKRIE